MKTSWVHCVALIALASVVCISASYAQAPRTLLFCGTIVDDNGKPLSGDHNITILYSNGRGDSLFGEIFHCTSGTDGAFKINLGSTSESGFPASMDFREPYYIAVFISKAGHFGRGTDQSGGTHLAGIGQLYPPSAELLNQLRDTRNQLDDTRLDRDRALSQLDATKEELHQAEDQLFQEKIILEQKKVELTEAENQLHNTNVLDLARLKAKNKLISRLEDSVAVKRRLIDRLTARINILNNLVSPPGDGDLIRSQSSENTSGDGDLIRGQSRESTSSDGDLIRGR